MQSGNVINTCDLKTCPDCKEEFLEEIWDDAVGESLEDDCK